MYCLLPEKPLRLFIPLIISGGIWSAADYLAPQGLFLREASVLLFTRPSILYRDDVGGSLRINIYVVNKILH